MGEILRNDPDIVWDRSHEPLFVCGLARCGTTLMMSMLEAAGIPTDGEKPWEHITQPVNAAQMWPRWEGRAVKMIDPHRAQQWPKQPAKVLWMERNYAEQAASQVKWLVHVAGENPPEDAQARFMAYLIREDLVCRRLFSLLGYGVYRVSFENTIAYPKAVGAALSFFIGRMLSVDAMAKVVVKREPKAAAGFEIEQAMRGTKH